jgi:CheY-like chemotaxis protein
VGPGGGDIGAYNPGSMPSGAPGSPVLIVEDDADLREVYADALAAEGYGVELASDGNEALARLSEASELPCAVLLDLRMPGMDGWELARRLRDSAQWSQLPILVVAAHYLVADEARRIGAAGWLQKPVTLDRLVTAVRGICGPLAGGAGTTW